MHAELIQIANKMIPDYTKTDRYKDGSTETYFDFSDFIQGLANEVMGWLESHNTRTYDSSWFAHYVWTEIAIVETGQAYPDYFRDNVVAY